MDRLEHYRQIVRTFLEEYAKQASYPMKTLLLN